MVPPKFVFRIGQVCWKSSIFCWVLEGNNKNEHSCVGSKTSIIKQQQQRQRPCLLFFPKKTNHRFLHEPISTTSFVSSPTERYSSTRHKMAAMPWWERHLGGLDATDATLTLCKGNSTTKLDSFPVVSQFPRGFSIWRCSRSYIRSLECKC